MTVLEAQAAYQSAADRRNSLDAELGNLRADESALSDQIDRSIADGADPATLADSKAARDALREQISDLDGASRFVDADLAAASITLKAAQKAERQAALVAVIADARTAGAAYSDALAAFLDARNTMRALASKLPGQESAVIQLIEDVIGYALRQSPSNPAYGQPFSVLLESYLSATSAQ